MTSSGLKSTARFKRFAIGFLASVSIFAAASAPSWASSAEIKLGHDMPESSPHHQATVRWKELVEERTGGDVTVTIFPSSMLGSATQMVEQVQAGALEAAMLPNAQIAPIAPDLSVLDLPFLFPSRGIAHDVVDGPIGDIILKTLDGTGIVGLAHWESGFKQFTGSFQIRTPKDYAGHKIRTMPSQVVQEQFRAFDAVPTQIAFSELYSALQQGVVDGQENPISTISAGKLYEVQPYITLSDHAFLGEIFMLNQSFFEGMDEETRGILVTAAEEARDYQRQLIQENEQQQLELFKKAGVQIIELTPEARAAFIEASKPVYEWYKKEEGGAILDQIEAEVEKLSAAAGDQ